MERGPRMFGVRYGPCDRPSLDEEELVTEVKPAYDVANRYINSNVSSYKRCKKVISILQ